MISYYVGLDVSKATVDVGFLPANYPQFQVSNDLEGFTRLITCLNELNRPGFSRHLASSLRNAFQTLPVTADC